MKTTKKTIRPGRRHSMCKRFSIQRAWQEPLWNIQAKDTIFTQGDLGKEVMYIQKGSVKLSVVSKTGKEAVVAMLKPGDFLGESALAGQSMRMATATAIVPVTLLVIGLKEMIRVLHMEHEFSDRFIAYMIGRNIRIEEDLVDQLFNSSEKRLARTLLLLARYGNHEKPQFVLPKDIAGDAGGNGGHYTIPRQFFHEQIQEAGIHQLRWRAARE